MSSRSMTVQSQILPDRRHFGADAMGDDMPPAVFHAGEGLVVCRWDDFTESFVPAQPEVFS